MHSRHLSSWARAWPAPRRPSRCVPTASPAGSSWSAMRPTALRAAAAVEGLPAGQHQRDKISTTRAVVHRARHRPAARASTGTASTARTRTCAQRRGARWATTSCCSPPARAPAPRGARCRPRRRALPAQRRRQRRTAGAFARRSGWRSSAPAGSGWRPRRPRRAGRRHVSLERESCRCWGPRRGGGHVFADLHRAHGVDVRLRADRGRDHRRRRQGDRS